MSHWLMNSERTRSEDSHWLSVSDLMAGLMMVFLCIAMVMMRSMLHEREKIRMIAMSYQQNQLAIYEGLKNEFDDDLERWGAVIDKDSLTIVFNTPDSMFDTGETELNEQYQNTLSEFFPRYMKVLEPFTDSINEIRLEGHTSSGWKNSTDQQNAYFKNLALSQARTRSVLQFVTDLNAVEHYQAWMNQNIAAVGFSSSRTIKDEYGNEDVKQSKRVAFRVITNSDEKIKKILEETR